MKLVFDMRMQSWSGIGRYSFNLVKEFLKKDSLNFELYLIGKKDDFTKVGTFSEEKKFHEIILEEDVFSATNLIGLGKARTLRFLENSYLLHVPHFTCSVLDTSNLVITIHDLMPLKYPIISKRRRLIYYIWNRLAALKARKIITVSNFVKNDLKKFFNVPDEKIRVIYLAADEIFLNSDNVKHVVPFDFEYALCFANWKFHKGLDVVLYSLEAWPKNIVLVLVGKEPGHNEVSAEILKIINEYKAKGKIRFVDNVSDEMLVNLYRNAKFFLHPSREEGFGLPPLEAMAVSTPVIASKTEISTEILKDAPLYFTSGSPQSLAAAVEQLVESEALQKELREKGKKLAFEYSWRKTAELTCKVYNEVWS